MRRNDERSEHDDEHDDGYINLKDVHRCVLVKSRVAGTTTGSGRGQHGLARAKIDLCLSSQEGTDRFDHTAYPLNARPRGDSLLILLACLAFHYDDSDYSMY